MSAGDLTPLASWQGIAGLLGALGLGGFLTALAQRPSRRTVEANAAKDEATGEAAVIAAIASAFTGTTTSLHEEVDRLQSALNELRQRVVEVEEQLKAALAREAILERTVADQKAQLGIAHQDVVRIRGERDTAVDKTIQQEGEIRQLKSVIEAQSRVGGTI